MERESLDPKVQLAAHLFSTREVMVGNVGVGGNNPIRLQSMTTSSTRDVDATVDQIMKLSDYGCEIARVTVQGMKEADSCELIKNRLLQKGYSIPLVADIHFYPPAAMRVVEFVDKVRINPGNFVDKRASFKQIEYDDNTYAEEIEKIEESFLPLIERSKTLKRAMRIGTNHGSLSDRIMSRYGDSPNGMVQSALEFARVCRKHAYHDFIFSMKASNPLVMIEAYRLLVVEMRKMGWDYPLHLGVTEAGNGEDGRMKSAVGMGSLLVDGIGDTIRVSLTEDPWDEIDPGKRIIGFINSYKDQLKKYPASSIAERQEVVLINAQAEKNLSLHPDGSVFACVLEEEILADSFFEDIGYKMSLGSLSSKAESIQGIILKEMILNPVALRKIEGLKKANVLVISAIDLKTSSPPDALKFYYQKTREDERVQEKITSSDWVFVEPNDPKVHEMRIFHEKYKKVIGQKPLILCYSSSLAYEDLVIQLSIEMGSIFADGIGHGIYLDAPNLSLKQRCLLSLNLLQSCRRRSSKTDYIACPGCGRTLFDLQEVTNTIKKETSHLPGVKIAVMGCIVNGPGEMADADFGYVGSRTGMIDLYVGKTCVEKNIETALACEKLVHLIKSSGRWIEKPLETADAIQ